MRKTLWQEGLTSDKKTLADGKNKMREIRRERRKMQLGKKIVRRGRCVTPENKNRHLADLSASAKCKFTLKVLYLLLLLSDFVKEHKGEKKVQAIFPFFSLVQGDSPSSSRLANFLQLSH
jgi:hypothetical protein